MAGLKPGATTARSRDGASSVFSVITPKRYSRPAAGSKYG
jgi:hypothetical protein